MKLISSRPSTPLHPAPPLPLEIINQIVEYLDPSSAGYQSTLYSCCLVSRIWYSACISYLYARPRLTGKNFEKFAATLCPPVGSHAKTGHAAVDLGFFVRYLDMGGLVYTSSKSLTARLLRRVRGGLETFVADATSFSINSFAPLSKCHNLRELNLILVSGTESHDALIHAVADLPYLTVLRFPRFGVEKPHIQPGFLNKLPSLKLLDIPQESLLQGCQPLLHLTPLLSRSHATTHHHNHPSSSANSSPPPLDPDDVLKPNHPLRELEIFYGRRHSRDVMMILPALVERLQDLYQITFMGSMDSDDVYDDDDEAVAEDVDVRLKEHGRRLNESIASGSDVGSADGVGVGIDIIGSDRGRGSGGTRPTKKISKNDMGIFWEDI